MILISMAGLHNLESDEGHTAPKKTAAGHMGRFWWGILY